jgi:class 3 adenylate cyclase
MVEGTQRRLAVIVQADVVGYSRLIGLDEEGTLGRLRAHRAEWIDPKISEHGGRIVKTMGDGVLLEFPSVVNATCCAIDIQSGMRERNAAQSDGQRIDFRIGINLGDVVVDDDDIHGDGVNVAARLEGLAEPGGICLSRAARDQVLDRIEASLKDMGEIKVKNIARPIQVFKVVLEGQAAPKGLARLPRFHRRGIAAVLAVVIAFYSHDIWFGGELPNQPSVAVLPFENMVAEARRAITLAPNNPEGFEALASALVYLGQPVEALENLAIAERLAPENRKANWLVRGMAHLFLGDTEKAARNFEMSIAARPNSTRTYSWLISAYGHAGRSADAKATIEKLNSLRKAEGTERLTLGHESGRVKLKRDKDKAYYLLGLKKAGFPIATGN